MQICKTNSASLSAYAENTTFFSQLHILELLDVGCCAGDVPDWWYMVYNGRGAWPPDILLMFARTRSGDEAEAHHIYSLIFARSL